MTRRKIWLVLLMVMLSVVMAGSCASNQIRTGSSITPDYFQFADIVPDDEYGGGWRAVCIKADVGQSVTTKWSKPVPVVWWP